MGWRVIAESSMAYLLFWYNSWSWMQIPRPRFNYSSVCTAAAPVKADRTPPTGELPTAARAIVQMLFWWLGMKYKSSIVISDQ